MRPITISRQLDAADADGICLSQNPTAADLTINGAFAAGGVATLNAQREVLLTSGGNLSGITFTVTGTNDQNVEISETVTGPNAGTVTTSANFLTVTSITPSGAVGVAVTVGTNGVGASAPIPVDVYLSPTDIGLAIVVIGTVNVTVQHTFDDVFDPSATLTWFDHPTLANETANADGNLAFPPRAVRLLTNSGTGTATLTLVQAGAIS